MPNRKSDHQEIVDQIEQLTNLLASIEQTIRREHPHHGKSPDDAYDGEPMCCGLPTVPARELEAGIDSGRESLIRSIEKKWVNGTQLKYHLYKTGAWGGNSTQQQIVRDAFAEWKDVGIGLTFTEVDSPESSTIRIGFDRRPNEGSWSYVGRDVWDRSPSERTMNFGWHLRGQDGRDTALHEIGHTLGFHHEQQNPFSPIEWDEEAVYDYFTGPPNNWSRSKIDHNVLRTLDPNSVEGSNWDPDSIMQYSIRRGLILRPEQYHNGLRPAPGLSDTDRERVRQFYPELEEEYPELKTFRAKRLKVDPGGQANFVIRPNSTRQYSIQTFGNSDTLLVLFEDNGTLDHVAADDDSGWNRNASLRVRLVQGREYVLRVRLYYAWARRETAVMMW